ncbi:MAG: hypothetical protein A2836_00015 [Candidatus Taylorbacteria bacterium RIFCSPHIGHO2_01_FULL_45_63]|uniref:Major facilitator superfamily (MFS) profile domain-containing protein n=1 Tax=Candidatus Taylorbacteria bacterium RIFCSPHIGHO2_02_FULL_45_35 TaxID=1802311 RepID=A0A1G2MTM5_9BACT|nr:MAG: hypothetical protein A2836_00015 [Candidatus Taylorbacteria bacterium RIFCSPHIGHO2_01_FULL_45_63]OHA27216.1 MAG: hypothetical protein A3D56_02040 [Candidatus Taylorbacteria bacterium RIFCSPHIGHO2_02_FULL_45_35]OHA33710.1 MAG: hypothetical protein A3A22_03975 [Candidatus Taylorbacteria bacterium RIFCSPLOWO2_01_FULL_45_34b]
MENERKRHRIFTMYLLAFLLTLHAALPVYINSSFLSTITGEKYVGLIYILCSILTIFALTKMSVVLKAIGNYTAVLSLLALETACLIIMAFSEAKVAVIAAFILNFIAIVVIGLTIDIFLESDSSSKKVGRIRGMFLTSANAAWIIAPAISSFILSDSEYSKIFLAAALLSFPVFFLIHHNLKDFKDPPYQKIAFFQTLREVWRDKNILGIFMINFLLQFFFTWMVIYTPIYLHQYIGFSWREIGIIFSIMLLPFVILEIPLGRLADTRYGEKEMLAIGFIVMAVSTGLVSFIPVKDMALWIVLLFLTRVGASTVEVMSETYFFKKIDPDKVHIMSAFRMLRPLSYTISPIAAMILLFFIPLQYLFIPLAFLLFYGVRYSLTLEDTR